jgi:hypothetical protein
MGVKANSRSLGVAWAKAQKSSRGDLASASSLNDCPRDQEGEA